MWFERVRNFFQKTSEPDRRGTVKFFNRKRGYGFISVERLDQDVFVHVTELKDRISKGDRVAFDVETGKKGLEARNVRLVEA